MAKIKLYWTELISKSKEVEVPFNDTLLLADCDTSGFATKTELSSSIEDYFLWNENEDFLLNMLSESEQDSVYDEVNAEVLNLEELTQQMLHLVTPANKCCKTAQ